MKRSVLLIYVFTVVTMLTLGDDIVERIMYEWNIPETKAKICQNKTNLKLEDAMRYDELEEYNVHLETIDKSVYKVGCFFACIYQEEGIMSGANIDTDYVVRKLEKMINIAELKLYRDFVTTWHTKLIDCLEKIETKNDNCKIGMEILQCDLRTRTGSH